MVDAADLAAVGWAGDLVGGTVVVVERQADRPHGGRPAYFVDVERGGRSVRCYARLQRPELRDGGAALRTEGAVLDALAAAGVRVPRVLGFHPEPPGLLLECLPGTGDYAQIPDDARRWELDRQFLDELVKIHAADTAPFEAIGLERPATAEAFLLADLDRWVGVYRAMARRPVPLIEFLDRWLRRHVPGPPARAVVVQGDTGPGQFMFEGPTMTGIVDWEFAQLGDPHLDLALIRGRDFYNPGADLRRWFRTYQELAGRTIDWDTLAVYTVKAIALTPLSLAGLCQAMPAATDYAEWWTMDAAYSRATAQALAEAAAVPLDPSSVEVPEPVVGAADDFLCVLEEVLDSEFRPSDPFGRSRMDQALRLTRMIRNAAGRDRDLQRLELDDLATVLGHRPVDLATGDAEMTDVIAADDPGRDADIISYLWRRSVRHEALFAGTLGAGEGAVLIPLDELR